MKKRELNIFFKINIIFLGRKFEFKKYGVLKNVIDFFRFKCGNCVLVVLWFIDWVIK